MLCSILHCIKILWSELLLIFRIRIFVKARKIQWTVLLIVCGIDTTRYLLFSWFFNIKLYIDSHLLDMLSMHARLSTNGLAMHYIFTKS